LNESTLRVSLAFHQLSVSVVNDS